MLLLHIMNLVQTAKQRSSLKQKPFIVHALVDLILSFGSRKM